MSLHAYFSYIFPPSLPLSPGSILPDDRILITFALCRASLTLRLSFTAAADYTFVDKVIRFGGCFEPLHPQSTFVRSRATRSLRIGLAPHTRTPRGGETLNQPIAVLAPFGPHFYLARSLP